jgi:uncharacterized repeat protein (TIGR03803 family)
MRNDVFNMAAPPKEAPMQQIRHIGRRQALLGLAALGTTPWLGSIARAGGVAPAGTWPAEVLHGFTWSEGSRAVGTPVFGPDGALYGIHALGGERGLGTLFRWSSADGFSMVRHFDYADGGPAEPEAGLIVGSDGVMWGTSMFGGTTFQGTIYSVSTDGTVTVRAEFDSSLGMNFPQGALLEGKPGRFYVTTANGVYRFDSRNSKLKVLYRFDGTHDGGGSTAALVRGPDGKLYGTNAQGGKLGHGTLFRLDADGSNFEVLKPLDGKWEGSGLGHPLLLASDGNFYGCTSGGGVFNRGVVFRISLKGHHYEVLHHFAGGSNDGSYPRCALVEGADGALYGNTVEGGAAPQSYGTVFRMTKRGKLSLIHRFSENGDTGATPVGALCFGPDGELYGTNQSGGTGHAGVLHCLRKS